MEWSGDWSRLEGATTEVLDEVRNAMLPPHLDDKAMAEQHAANTGHQPRERAVQCRYSTMTNRHTTWNVNAICDSHQAALAQIRNY